MKSILKLLFALGVLCSGVLLTQCDLFRPVAPSPQFEFSIPLAIGNQWIYDINVDDRRGVETWAVINQAKGSNGTTYLITLNGSGQMKAPPYNPYSFTAETQITMTEKYYLFRYNLATDAWSDTLFRFSDQVRDTIKFIHGGTSTYARFYANKVGLVYDYDDGGSPGSGRYYFERKLRSYSFK